MPFYYDFNKSHENKYLRLVQQIYRPLGFQRGYNFPLWIIFGGAIFGFGCARVMYLDIDGIFAQGHVIPGDWEYFRSGHYYVGIIMHLATAIPICFLVPWQFLPVVRHTAMLFHRSNGYLLIILLLLTNVGALMIARRSLGGGLDVQVLVGILAVYTTVSVVMAYVNIKRLQIDQHRAWMLRTWVVAASIITLRIIQIIARQIISQVGDYHHPMACHTIDFITSSYGPSQMHQYAACREDPLKGWAAVNADFFSTRRVEQIGASVDLTFGMSGIVSTFIHAVAIELYLHLTPVERDRLKQVSYEKQLARGWKRPGNAGLTVQVWGDARAWHPEEGEKNDREGSEDPLAQSDTPRRLVVGRAAGDEAV